MAADFNDLNIGMNRTGVHKYLESLNFKIDELTTFICQTGPDSFMELIEKNWIGASKEKFKTEFYKRTGELRQLLEKEYKDLYERADELMSSFQEEDAKILGEKF